MTPSCPCPSTIDDVIRTQTTTMSVGSKGSKYSKGGTSNSVTKSTGYQFQRFQGEGQDEDSQFESVKLLSLEAAEALCSRMKDGIPVEVCASCIRRGSGRLASRGFTWSVAVVAPAI